MTRPRCPQCFRTAINLETGGCMSCGNKRPRQRLDWLRYPPQWLVNIVCCSGMLLLFGGICAAVWAFTSWQCSSKTDVMGLPSTWGPVQGCMIQVDKRWIPIESYRTIGGVD